MPSAELPVIRASELGQHAYCARSWWLSRVKGYASAHTRELAAGRNAHAQHGRGVARALLLQRTAYVLLAAGLLLALVAITLHARGW